MIDRSKKPRDLKIDFATLEKQKQHEYAKLDRMMEYSRSHQCRRSFLLGYFGERTAGTNRCGGCDNCGSASADALADAPAAEGGIVSTARGRELILKVLSGIARAKGRFGKITVAQMLAGSDSERMSRWKLDQLSTFGILKEYQLTRKEVTEIIDALVRARLVESQDVDRYKPVINLTEMGWHWLKGPDRPDLALDLTAHLLRRICGKPSAAEQEPSSPRESRAAVSPGIPLAAPALRPPPESSSSSAPTASSHVATEEWTSRLIDRGFTIAEAAAIRGLEPSIIIRHLTWMVRKGHPVALETLLAPEVIAAWDAWLARRTRKPPARNGRFRGPLAALRGVQDWEDVRSLIQGGWEPTGTVTPAAGCNHRGGPAVQSGATAIIGLAGKLGKLREHRSEV